jgi:hypothetical protein
MVPVAHASPKPVETLPMPVETRTTPTGEIPRKNPCRSTHAPAGLRGLDLSGTALGVPLNNGEILT